MVPDFQIPQSEWCPASGPTKGVCYEIHQDTGLARRPRHDSVSRRRCRGRRFVVDAGIVRAHKILRLPLPGCALTCEHDGVARLLARRRRHVG